MPDYDLGTAHGRVKITADTSQVKQAESAVSSFARELRSISTSVTATNASLNRIESQLRSLTREYKRAEQAADDLGGVHVSLAKNIGNSSRDFNTIRNNVIGVTSALLRPINLQPTRRKTPAAAPVFVNAAVKPPSVLL